MGHKQRSVYQYLKKKAKQAYKAAKPVVKSVSKNVAHNVKAEAHAAKKFFFKPVRGETTEQMRARFERMKLEQEMRDFRKAQGMSEEKLTGAQRYFRNANQRIVQPMTKSVPSQRAILKTVTPTGQFRPDASGFFRKKSALPNLF